MKKFLVGLLIILVAFVLFSVTPLVLMLVWNYVIAQLFADSLKIHQVNNQSMTDYFFIVLLNNKCYY